MDFQLLKRALTLVVIDLFHQNYLYKYLSETLQLNSYILHFSWSFNLTAVFVIHNCMATAHFSPCSSSLKHHETQLFSEFVVVPRKSSFSTWVSQVQSRIQARKRFQLKSSNGYPLHAISLQDSEFFVLLLLSFLVACFISVVEL